jgi:5-methylcytosine-specific restriction endonuclease McrA
MPHKDSAKKIEYHREYREKRKDQINEQKKEYHDDRTQHAYESITSRHIIDHKKWNLWCDKIKSNAEKKKHSFSAEFTNDIMFDMMIRGCYYCGSVATTIDRLDSSLNHTPENCVGCCGPCNNSKGASDPSTFVRKSYYKARRKYVDDVIDVWFENKTKPNMMIYKRNARNQGVPFELSKEKWNSTIVGECAYCHRKPVTWFGIDRVVPSLGYVNDNIVTCCFDCNVDKHVHDIDTTIARNERIANRVDDGELVIKDCSYTILHQGARKTSKKVCAYGKVYTSQNEATRVIKKTNDITKKKDVRNCIRRGTNTDDIFRITDEFYDAYKNSDVYVTKSMFERFCTNE